MSRASLKVLLVLPTLSLDETVRELAACSTAVAFPGVAVVVDEAEKILGVVTDGDIRRAYARDFDFSKPVGDAMTREPFTVNDTIALDEVVLQASRWAQARGRTVEKTIRHVLVADTKGKLVDVYDFIELLTSLPIPLRRVAVIGMGFVGLTLAATLANQGHLVTGFDIDKKTTSALNEGELPIHEPGLEDILDVNRARAAIRFESELGSGSYSIYIICVGTPLGDDGNPDIRAVEKASADVAKQMERGAIVILRSTVPVGSTRGVCLPILEAASGLKCGTDFSLAFAPERTVEGNALREIRELPQVIGGFTALCRQKVSEFWSTICPSTIQVESLESAEIVKLANNTFRDLSFAFANEVALICSQFNINASELVRAANEGYPRNMLALPSAGVGGYCLTKDPLLFDHSVRKHLGRSSLGYHSRAVNELAGQYPVDVVTEFANATGRELRDLQILIVGVAFKGEPETNDTRGSVAVSMGHTMQEGGAKVLAWDAVVEGPEIVRLGFEAISDLRDGVADADVVLILNNHRANIAPKIYVGDGRRKLIFDGWALLDPKEVARESGLEYATMGYRSFDL
jgi:nucleotide sugar dehydrogenase